MIVLQPQHKEKKQRQRGVIFALQELEELETAKTNAELEQDSGTRYTWK